MTVPVPPPQDPRKRRHSLKTVMLARTLYGDGDSWTPSQIRRYLHEKHGIDAALSTVRGWVVPGVADEQRRRNSDGYHRRRNGTPKPARVGSLDERMLRLRQLGLSYRAIAVVLAEYHDTTVEVEYVRSRLRRLGVPKHPAKVAAGRRVWEQRKAAETADDLRAAA